MSRAITSITIAIVFLITTMAICTSSAFATSNWTLKDKNVSISKVGSHDAHIQFTKKSGGENYRIAYAKHNSSKWHYTNTCGKKYANKNGKAKFYTGSDNYLNANTKYKVKFQVKVNNKWITAKNTNGKTFVKTFTTDKSVSRGGEALHGSKWY